MGECKQSVYIAAHSEDMIDAVNKGFRQGSKEERERILKMLHGIDRQMERLISDMLDAEDRGLICRL